MTDDWFDALVALLEAGARFLVVGAHALAVHGIPRGTQDIDIWIDPSPENARRVWEGLAAFDRVEQPVREREIPFIGRATLVRNKRATGRTKDLADLEALGEAP